MCQVRQGLKASGLEVIAGTSEPSSWLTERKTSSTSVCIRSFVRTVLRSGVEVVGSLCFFVLNARTQGEEGVTEGGGEVEKARKSRSDDSDRESSWSSLGHLPDPVADAGGLELPRSIADVPKVVL